MRPRDPAYELYPTLVAIVLAIVLMIIVVIAVIFTIPMAFVQMPAIVVAIIVRVTPIGAGIRRTIPSPGNPNVTTPIYAPVSVNPGIAFAWHLRAALIAHWWRRAPDDDADLRRGLSCESSSRNSGHGQGADK